MNSAIGIDEKQLKKRMQEDLSREMAKLKEDRADIRFVESLRVAEALKKKAISESISKTESIGDPKLGRCPDCDTYVDPKILHVCPNGCSAPVCENCISKNVQALECQDVCCDVITS